MKSPLWLVQHPVYLNIWVADSAMKARIARKSGCLVTCIPDAINYKKRGNGGLW